MKDEWKAKRTKTCAALYHENGLLKIRRYLKTPEALKRNVRVLYSCYYRLTPKDLFGWHVDYDAPYYLTLQQAKDAGLAWIRNQK